MVLMKSLEQVNFNLEFTNQSHDLSNHVCKKLSGNYIYLWSAYCEL